MVTVAGNPGGDSRQLAWWRGWWLVVLALLIVLALAMAMPTARCQMLGATGGERQGGKGGAGGQPVIAWPILEEGVFDVIAS